MIISRTPMRISLGGGGSDMPSYYERFGVEPMRTRKAMSDVGVAEVRFSFDHDSSIFELRGC
jgi:galactokinase/mevalonate kinase-like predicted kinase